jgi:hypothetical protein
MKTARVSGIFLENEIISRSSTAYTGMLISIQDGTLSEPKSTGYEKKSSSL